MSNQTCFLGTAELYDASKLLSRVSKEIYNLPHKAPGNVYSWEVLHGYDKILDGTGQPRAAIYHSSNNEYENQFIVAFKGSESGVDWIQNLKALPLVSRSLKTDFARI